MKLPRTPKLALATLCFYAISLGVTPTPALAAPERAAPVHAADGKVEIVVDTVYQYEDLQRWLQERSDQVLQRASPPPDTAWDIDIEVLGHMGNYRVTVTAHRDGNVVVAPAEPEICKCSSDAVLDLVETRLQAAAEALSVPPQVDALTDTAPPPDDPQVVSPPPPAPELAPDPEPPVRRWGIGGVGIAGTAVLVTGLCGGLYGLIQATRKPERQDAGQLGVLETPYDTPLSNAIGITGGALMAVGIVMIAIDQGVCKKRPRGCQRHGARQTQPSDAPLTFRF